MRFERFTHENVAPDGTTINGHCVPDGAVIYDGKYVTIVFPRTSKGTVSGIKVELTEDEMEQFKTLRAITKCGECGATDVRLYRPYGSFYREKDNRCNEHVTAEERGYFVPLLVDHDGGVWGYSSATPEACKEFYALPENNPKAPIWISSEDCWSDRRR